MAKRIQFEEAEHLTTEAKLEQLRCPGMLEEYLKQSSDIRYSSRSFEERFSDLVSAEYNSRINNRIEKEKKAAKMCYPTAAISEAVYLPERQINQNQIERLSKNDYIRNGNNIAFIGASGNGKSWFACALANEAIKAGYTVRYIKMTDLLYELTSIKSSSEKMSIMEYRNRLCKPDLLIIDDFLLQSLEAEEVTFLLSLIETRRNPIKINAAPKSLILCSQWLPKGWHSHLGGGVEADAILDRLVNNSYIIELKGRSMREVTSNIQAD